MPLPASLAAAGKVSGHSRQMAMKWAMLNTMARRIEGVRHTASRGTGDTGAIVPVETDVAGIPVLSRSVKIRQAP